MQTSATAYRWLATGLSMVLSTLPIATWAQSATRGQTLFESRCVACHSLEANRVGPALQTVVGRKAGTAKDYDYSPALAKAGHQWSKPLLLAWLTDPEKLVPGQRMGYRVEDATDREDLVAYLSAVAKGASGNAK